MAEFNLIKTDGKPIEKLIDVISKGIGTIYKPRAIRKEAEAEAYRIEIIERAKSKALVEGQEIQLDAYERLQGRLLHTELKRQENIDKISQIAAEQLSQESSVSDNPVDKDWTTRFFNIASDISNEEMQSLWGRILAGEVKEPQSFSLRTLEILKNLTKHEAEIFTRVAKISLKANLQHFIFEPEEPGYLEREFQIEFEDLLLLVDVGLIVSERTLSLNFIPTDEKVITPILYGTKGFFVTLEPTSSTFGLSVKLFTRAGSELQKLIDPLYHEGYILQIAKALKTQISSVSFGDITITDDGLFEMDNEENF